MSTDALREQIIEACKQVHDPEIPVNIYDLGLIYKIDIADDRKVAVEMTLTTPNCPSAQELPMVEDDDVRNYANLRVGSSASLGADQCVEFISSALSEDSSGVGVLPGFSTRRPATRASPAAIAVYR